MDVDTSQFAKKDDFRYQILKLDIDQLAELDADELKPVPVEFFFF